MNPGYRKVICESENPIMNTRDAILVLQSLIRDGLLDDRETKAVKCLIDVANKKKESIDIVHCAKCKYCETLSYIDGTETSMCTKFRYREPVRPDDFCSHGEKIETGYVSESDIKYMGLDDLIGLGDFTENDILSESNIDLSIFLGE